MSYFEKPVSDRISFSRMAIQTCIESPELSEKLGRLGYTHERLQDGYNTVLGAEKADRIQNEEYGEQYAATKAAETSFAEAKPEIADFTELLDIQFEDDTAIYTKLELHKRREHSREPWVQQNRQLFTTVLEDSVITDGMIEFGCTRDEIERLSNLVAAVDARSREQNQETGEAQRATILRNEKVEEMDTWMRRFMRIAHIALRRDPQLLEQLGIVVKSA